MACKTLEQKALTISLLGVILIGVIIWTLYPHHYQISLFLFSICLYHFGEYAFVMFHHPQTISYQSNQLRFYLTSLIGFLIFYNHPAYLITLSTGLIEYGFQYVIAPQLKNSFEWFRFFAGVLMISGQLIRVIAQFTAKSNYNHNIQTEKSQTHVFIREGVYKLIRHPGYSGWFMWAVCSQILLNNPLCTVFYYYMSHKFFKERITYQEKFLIQFFGDQYRQYKKEVWSGIPFNEGFDEEKEKKVQ